MPEYQRKNTKIVHKGLQWDTPIDSLPEGQVPFAKNVRVPQVDSVTQRPGLTKFADISASPGAQYVHSISKLNNTNTQLVNFSSVYIAANNLRLFVGDSAAHLEDPSINPVPLPEPGKGPLSGNPLTFVDMAPVGTNVGWKYVGDYTRNFKIGYYPGDTTNPGSGNNGGKARVLTVGVTPPVFDANFTITLTPGTLTGAYMWCFAYRNKYTGERSNPSAPTRESVASPAKALTNQSATFTVPLAPADPLTGLPDTQNWWVDVYRSGGTLDDWRWVGFTTGGSNFTDTITDDTIMTAPTPPQVTDPITGVTRFNLYRPFVTQDNARYSTTGGTVNLINGKWYLDTGAGDQFDVNWLPGNVISINNNDYTIHQVITPSRLEVEQDLGGILTSGSSYPWATQTGILRAGAPLSHIWGPYGIGQAGAYVFGCGGVNCDAGTLYWTNGNDPDSSDLINSVLVTSPSEPLRGGCIYDGTPFCFSTERMFRIYPGNIAGQFTVQEVPGGKGLWAEYSLTVQSSGVADQNISWVGKDGIYNWSASAGLECLTDGTIYPFFPHGNQPGVNLGKIFPVLVDVEQKPITAPDFSTGNMKYHRLTWFMGELFYDYPAGASNNFQTLVFDSRQVHGWVSVDQYAMYISTSVGVMPVCRGVEIAANNMLVGIGNVVANYTGTSDFGNTIPCRLITRADDLGEPRLQKLYGDYWMDLTPGSGSVTVKPWLDNFTIDIGATVIPTGTRQQKPINLASAIGYLGRNWGMEFNWNADVTPAILYQFSYSYVPKPEFSGNRITDKTDDGYLGAKYLRGVCIEANTQGQNRSIKVVVDDQQVATLAFNSQSQLEIPFAITPTVGSEFQLQPGDTTTWEIFSVRWVWEKWPDATPLESNWMNMGTTKPKYIRGFSIPVSAASGNLSFTLAYDSGSVVLPAVVVNGATRKSPARFDVNPPVLGHQVKLVPSIACRCWYDEIVWDAEEWPEAATFYGPFEKLGDSGAKYLRGLELPMETGGATVNMLLHYDVGVSRNINLGTENFGGYTTDPLVKGVFALTPSAPIIAHQFQLRSLGNARFWYDEVKWDFEPWPEIDTGRSPWLDSGNLKSKYVRAFLVPIDTGGQAVIFDLYFDNRGPIAMGPFTTTAGVKTVVKFAFTVPVIIHEFQLVPRSPSRVWYDEIKWDAEVWPELLTEASPWLDDGTPKNKYVRAFLIPIDTNGTSVTFDLMFDNRAPVVMGPFTTQAGVKTVFKFAFTVPVIIHEFQLIPRSPCRIWHEEIKWDSEVWPEYLQEATPWLDNGTPSAKLVRAITMPVDTGGLPVTFDLILDNGTTIPMGPFTTTAGQKTAVEFAFPANTIAHEFQIIPRGPARIWSGNGEIKWDAEAWPEQLAEVSSWTDMGNPGAKFLQGMVIPMDTSGNPVTYDLTWENGTIPIGPFTTVAGRKSGMAYSLPVPQIVHEVMLTPRSPTKTFYPEIKWIWEPVPELVTTYTSQETNLDLPGYSYLFDAYIAYIGTSTAPTLIIKCEYSTMTYTLPISDGVYTRAYLLLDPQKGKWHSFSIQCATGVRLFLKDIEIRAKNWTDKGSYPSAFQSHHPFGGEHRAVGALI